MFETPPPNDQPERPIDKLYRCWNCYISYPGSPKDHSCPDGTTFQQRLAKLDERALLMKDTYSKMVLSADDRRWLKNLNVRIDD